MLLTVRLHSKRSHLLGLQSSKNRISSKVRFNSTFVDSGNEAHKFDYDLIVIGGGSGGLACSKEAADLGKKVAVVDFVKPSPHSTTWGLGGTCVNVGCIPKKLMHQASLLGKSIKDAHSYGWDVPDRPSHNWNTMVTNVQNYIKSLNWGYRVQLRQKEITYINALASFTDPHSIQCIDKKGDQKIHTARRFVIAVGGRPKYLDIPGSELAITSDDVFSLRNPPGKTLVIGAGYIALETAGFLSGLGYSATVMARSQFLRSFDQQMAEKIVEYMELHGTSFVRGGIPQKIEKNEDGKLTVTYEINGEIKQDEFDTVMYAVGRVAETKSLGLANANVEYDHNDGKIITNNEQTSSSHIYAIGDTIKGPELTPVAIRAGKLLARRLYRGSQELMDYATVPTTVFTPLEYASCGLSEEAAIRSYGTENIEVYHANIQPLEWTVAHREENACYVKVLCNKKDNERVVGIHVLAPNAGEIVQGFAVAMRLGATKESIEQTVGIHPTIAEELILVRITKRSGEDPKKTGC